MDTSVEPGRTTSGTRATAESWESTYPRATPMSHPCTADIVLGQPSPFSHSACNGDSGFQGHPVRAAASAETLCGIPEEINSVTEDKSIVTMAIDAEGSLYVPDSFNNRVLKYENPFESDSSADVVWGQPDFHGVECNGGGTAPSADRLCFHSYHNRMTMAFYGIGVDIDTEGNLWVAEGGNNRVLRFPRDTVTGEIAKTADLVLGQAGFTGSAPGVSLRGCVRSLGHVLEWRYEPQSISQRPD